MPRLYGAPAYARPRRLAIAERPFDPDDLPIESLRASRDRVLLSESGRFMIEPTDDRDPLAETSFPQPSAFAFGPPADLTVRTGS